MLAVSHGRKVALVALLAWSHAGLALTDGTKDTRQVHVFGRQWQLTPSSYESIW